MSTKDVFTRYGQAGQSSALYCAYKHRIWFICASALNKDVHTELLIPSPSDIHGNNPGKCEQWYGNLNKIMKTTTSALNDLSYLATSSCLANAAIFLMRTGKRDARSESDAPDRSAHTLLFPAALVVISSLGVWGISQRHTQGLPSCLFSEPPAPAVGSPVEATCAVESPGTDTCPWQSDSFLLLPEDACEMRRAWLPGAGPTATKQHPGATFFLPTPCLCSAPGAAPP